MNITFTLLAVALLAMAGCGPAAESRKDIQAKEEAPSESAGDPTVKHKVLSFNLEGVDDKGKKTWEVNGRSAEAVSENEIKLDDIVANTYGEDSLATITADSGVYDRTRNNVRLEKNIKATIESTAGARSGFLNVSDEALAAPAGKEEKKSEKTKTIITCDGEVVFDYQASKAYFDRNVNVISEDGDINADRITVNLDPSTKRISSIAAEGNVKMRRGENLTYSQKATYVEAEKKVVLSGQPKIVISREGSLEEQISEK